MERGAAAGTCRASFAAGRVVTLHATTGTLSQFVGWGDPCVAGEGCQLVMSEARTATARFTGPRLRITADTVSAMWGAPRGSGTVSVVPGGVVCTIADNRMSAPCELEFVPGLATAVADVRVAMYRTRLAHGASSVPGTVRGRITSDVGGIDCRLTTTGSGRSGTCYADLPAGTVVTLRFTPEPGSVSGAGGATARRAPRSAAR